MPEPVEKWQAVHLVVMAEARLGRLPEYVRKTFIELLIRGLPIPALPGEAGFRESDWLDRREALS